MDHLQLKTLKDFSYHELALKKLYNEFQKELMLTYLKGNVKVSNKSKLDMLVRLSTGLITNNEELLNCINSVLRQVNIDQEYFEKKGRVIIAHVENFKYKHSSKVDNNSAVITPRGPYNIAVVSRKAGRGIWSNKEGSYTALADSIIPILEKFAKNEDINYLKSNLKAVVFEKHTTINPIATILNILLPSEFLLINNFIIKGLKKLYKNVFGEKLPVDVNKNISCYFEVIDKLKSTITCATDLSEYPIFMVLDHYLSLIKDNLVVDMRYHWLPLKL